MVQNRITPLLKVVIQVLTILAPLISLDRENWSETDELTIMRVSLCNDML